MKITSINTYFKICQNKDNNEYHKFNTQKTYQKRNYDVQQTQIQFSGKLYNFFRFDPIWHFKKFSISEYKNLSKAELIHLRKDYADLRAKNSKYYDRVENLHKEVAEYMKKALDKKYGENNYVVITIGRSMSSIGKVLGYKIGEENVVNIPMTNAAKYFNPEKIKKMRFTKELKAFVEYLNSKGLSKDKISNSGKNYIITDFCCTGISLAGAENLLKSQHVWGNLKQVSAADFLTDWAVDNDVLTLYDFILGKYKEYSFVNCCRKLSNCKSSEKNLMMAPRKIKLTWFKLLDNEMQRQKIGT